MVDPQTTDDEIKQKILEYVDKLEDAAYDQVPLIIQEYLNWKLFQHLFWGVFCVCFAAVLIRIMFYVTRIFEEKVSEAPLAKKEIAKWDCELVTGAGWPITGLISLFLFVAGIYNFMSAIHISMAPRAYILEQLSNMVKG